MILVAGFASGKGTPEENTIIISSAKRTSELPDRYTFQQKIHLNRIIHILGNKDHTIPIKNIHYDYLVEEGSHMMMITRAAEINQIINKILNHTEHR